MLHKLKKEDVVYINTILPFGGALAGKIKGAKVIYHLHETSIKPLVFKKFLFFIVKKTASHLVYVSHFLKEEEKMNIPSSVVYNALEEEYLAQAKKKAKGKKKLENILMICSLKEYKGVFEFLHIATKMPQYNFELVVNADLCEIDSFFKESIIPRNLQIFPKQSSVKSFYSRSDLVLNLSKPDQWIETFGLTAIEAMAYGIPVIVPPVGGIAEIVDEGLTGFKISSSRSNQIVKKINSLFQNAAYHFEIAKQAKLSAISFNEKSQALEIQQIIDSNK